MAFRPPARAGGGHSFSGGGGGGGHSFGGGFSGGGGSHFFFFGGGGGGGGGVGDAIFFVIVILIVVAVVVVKARNRRAAQNSPPAPAHRTATPPAPPAGSGTTASGGAPQPWASGQGAAPGSGDRPAIDTVRGDVFPGTHPEAAAAGGAHQDGVAAIAAHDPAFDQEAFLEQVQRAFFVVQEAWSERKPEMSRQVMADGLWQQHKVQIQGYIDGHKRNILGDLAVGDLRLVSAHTDATYDTIIVRVTAACSDYDVNDENGKVVRGNKRVETWSEDWTFQRSSKATTKPSGGTLSQKCPNCGAPLNVDLAGVCGYCHAPVMSGAYDWVLSRIAQLNV